MEYSDFIASIVSSCLQKDSVARPSIKELKLAIQKQLMGIMETTTTQKMYWRAIKGKIRVFQEPDRNSQNLENFYFSYGSIVEEELYRDLWFKHRWGWNCVKSADLKVFTWTRVEKEAVLYRVLEKLDIVQQLSNENLNPGDIVQELETKTSDGITWIRHHKGWSSLRKRIWNVQVIENIWRIKDGVVLYCYESPSVNAKQIGVLASDKYIQEIGSSKNASWIKHSKGWSPVLEIDDVFIEKVTTPCYTVCHLNNLDLYIESISNEVINYEISNKILQTNTIITELETRDEWARTEMGWIKKWSESVFMEKICDV